jgi:hypothetical protein
VFVYLDSSNPWSQGALNTAIQCGTDAIQDLKDAVATYTADDRKVRLGGSRLYETTAKVAKPQAAEPLFLAMSGFVIVMVVGSVAFGVKRFVQNRISGTGAAEADQEAQALAGYLGEVE